MCFYKKKVSTGIHNVWKCNLTFCLLWWVSKKMYIYIYWNKRFYLNEGDVSAKIPHKLHEKPFGGEGLSFSLTDPGQHIKELMLKTKTKKRKNAVRSRGRSRLHQTAFYSNHSSFLPHRPQLFQSFFLILRPHPLHHLAITSLSTTIITNAAHHY